MRNKLIGPLRQGRADLTFRLGARDVLVDRLFDPQDQMEAFAKSVVPKKLSVLSLQLQCLGCPDEGIESLLRHLAVEKRLSLRELSDYLDIVGTCVGSLPQPLDVIRAVADNALGFQPDGRSALACAMRLLRDFASMPPRDAPAALAALRGN